MNSILTFTVTLLLIISLYFCFLCFCKILSLIYQSAVSDPIAEYLTDDDLLTKYRPLKTSHFELNDKQQKLLNNIREHHNFLKLDHDIQLSVDEDDKATTEAYVALWVALFVYLGYLGTGCYFLNAFKSLAKVYPSSLLTLTVLMFAFLLVGCIACYKVAVVKIDESKAKAQSDQAFILNSKIVPFVEFDDNDVERLAFADAINDLNLIYQVNADLAPESKEQFKKVLTALIPSDSKFESITDVVKQLADDPETMKTLIKQRDPLIKQIQEWYTQYEEFFQKLYVAWLNLSNINAEKYKQTLVSNGDTDLMDSETKYQYFHQMGKTIDELH